MANNYLGKNFPTSLESQADGVTTKYLNLQGLADFWAKTKGYVDAQDLKLFNAAKAKIDDNDAAVRAYIESLTVNGNLVGSNKAEGQLGTELSVTIDGNDILVSGEAGDKVEIPVYGSEGYTLDKASNGYVGYKVDEAFANVDARLDGIEKELVEGVVNSLEVKTERGDYVEYTKDENGGVSTSTTVTDKVWVSISKEGSEGDNGFAKSTGDIVFTVDDTAINEKFGKLDEEINELVANAGVTNIAVSDVDGAENNRKGLVEISLQGTKDPVGVNSAYVGDGSKRGDILITLDETALDDALDQIDTTIADEIADRKQNVQFLAGDNAVIDSTTGEISWKPDTQTYGSLTAVSARLDEIDNDLVTAIEDKTQNEKYVSFDVKKSAESGDKSIELTLDDAKLQEYITKNEANLSALGDTADGQNKVLKVNGHTLITVTPGSNADYPQNTVSSESITLTTKDINRDPSNKNLEEQLADYDAKLDALTTATHFRGVYNSLAEAKTEIGDDLDFGDIVIIKTDSGDKEYIYNADPTKGGYVYDESQWVELGDTSVENQRIQKLETWVDNNIISQSEIYALFNSSVNADNSKDMQNFVF